MSDGSEFVDSHLAIDVELPCAVDALSLPELYIGLELDFASLGTEPPAPREDPSVNQMKDETPRSQSDGLVGPVPLADWLRYGCEQVLQVAGATACQPRNESGRQTKGRDRELDSGYHQMGACLEEAESGCVVYELFGDVGDTTGTLSWRPVTSSPDVGDLSGRASAPSGVDPELLDLSASCGNTGSEDSRLGRQIEGGVVRLVWPVRVGVLKPEFLGVVLEAVSTLNRQRHPSVVELAGPAEAMARVSRAWALNPLYSTAEVRRELDGPAARTPAMVEKDREWRSGCRDAFVRAVQARTALRDGDLPPPSRGDG